MKKLIIIFLLSAKAVGMNTTEMESIKQPPADDIRTISDVYQYFVDRQCDKPIASTAQAILESGWHLIDKNNNLVGMHIARNRPSFNIAKTGIKAKFETRKRSLDELMLWQLSTGVSKSTDYFRHLIRHGYNSKNSYVIDLQRIIDSEKFKKEIAKTI